MKGKPEFHEEYVSPRVSPLYEGTVDFDYSEVARNLGEPQDEHARLYEALGDSLRALFQYLVEPVNRVGGEASQREVGLRFLCAVKRMAPELFEAHPKAVALLSITNEGGHVA